MLAGVVQTPALHLASPASLPAPAHTCACPRSITQRLFDMKVAEGSEGLDVVGLVEQQPALLLQAGARVSSDETAAERLQVRVPVGL